MGQRQTADAAGRQLPASRRSFRLRAGAALAAPPTSTARTTRPSPGRPASAARPTTPRCVGGTSHVPTIHPIVAAKQAICSIRSARPSMCGHYCFPVNGLRSVVPRAMGSGIMGQITQWSARGDVVSAAPIRYRRSYEGESLMAVVHHRYVTVDGHRLLREAAASQMRPRWCCSTASPRVHTCSGTLFPHWPLTIGSFRPTTWGSVCPTRRRRPSSTTRSMHWRL